MSDSAKALQALLEGELQQKALWESLPKDNEEGMARLLAQLEGLGKAYPGGLAQYVANSQRLLKDSLEGKNPFEGYAPEVPEGENLDFTDPSFEALEDEGAEQLKDAAFVLVAGGLGERLGYNGIKLSLPVDIVTMTSYLEYYAKWVQAIQARYNVDVEGDKGKAIPFIIMTSDDTHTKTVDLIEANRNFGLAEGQLIVVKQEKVPALMDNDAAFVSTDEDPFEVITKPHGHGDVHSILYVQGVAQKLAETGRKWVIFIQDTNALQMRALPAAVAVSKQKGFVMNSLCIQRKPGEAVGAIVRLASQNAERPTMTTNVEYNQLDPLLRAASKASGGEEVGDVANPNDAAGNSPFPGNVNILVFALEGYWATLKATEGQMPEFVNPKYKDASKTSFKSPTRLECMMQDYSQLLAKSDLKVGFTCVDRDLGFSPAKNSIADARTKGSSASTAEHDMYYLNAKFLELCGAQVEWGAERQWAGVACRATPRVILDPSFGITRSEIRKHLAGGQCKVSARSTLSLSGNVNIKNLEVDGSVHIGAGRGAEVTVEQVKVTGNPQTFQEVSEEDASVGEVFRIRGYTVADPGTQPLSICYNAPGKYVATQTVSA